MEILLISGLIGLIIGGGMLVGGVFERDDGSAITGFIILALVGLLVVAPTMAYITNWSFTPYEFNEKNVNKHYEFKDKIYKIVLDTTETNMFIETKYKIKETK